MVNNTTQNAQKLIILISEIQKLSVEGHSPLHRRHPSEMGDTPSHTPHPRRLDSRASTSPPRSSRLCSNQTTYCMPCHICPPLSRLRPAYRNRCHSLTCACVGLPNFTWGAWGLSQFFPNNWFFGSQSDYNMMWKYSHWLTCQKCQDTGPLLLNVLF